MIKSVGLLQCREDLGPEHFRDHYENHHAPMATELLGFAGYLRNYPESAEARRELGVSGLTEFWFRDAAEIARIGALMQGDVGAKLIEDELRFMNVPANQTYQVSERLHGTRPAPGKALRAIAIQRLPAGARAGEQERRLDRSDARVRERRIPGVIAALYTVPERASMPLPPAVPGIGCIESLWLEGRAALAACNRWRAREGALPLSVVEEAGTAILAWPY
jgi:hypothetical protein